MSRKESVSAKARGMRITLAKSSKSTMPANKRTDTLAEDSEILTRDITPQRDRFYFAARIQERRRHQAFRARRPRIFAPLAKVLLAAYKYSG
jgi:hypothetical protein